MKNNDKLVLALIEEDQAERKREWKTARKKENLKDRKSQ
jgi:hypothetical protein